MSKQTHNTNTQTHTNMKVTRIREGVYRVTDSQGTWIAKRTFSSNSNKSYWCGWACENEHETNDYNSWAVAFPTFKLLKQFSQQ